MDPMPDLRRKNAAAAAQADGTAGLSPILPQVQAGVHYQRAEFSNRDNRSAGRKDAVLTAV